MSELKRGGVTINRKLLFCVFGILMMLFSGNGLTVSAKTPLTQKFFNDISWFLSPSDPFMQNWSVTNLIVADNDWSNVHSITGYTGAGLAPVAGLDPQTIIADGSGSPFVIANQSDPNTLTTGGVAEFDGIANPTIALQGSDAASAPHITVRLNFTDCPVNKLITVGYKLRDIESSSDDAASRVALQYRRGLSGNYTNVPSAFVADATEPNTATKVSTIVATLPHFAISPDPDENILYLRIITANAVGNDEWVGIDDINVGCFAPLSADASVSGRVISPTGQPIAKAVVSMTDEYGQIRKATTNPFGYYRFDYVQMGGIMILDVKSKSYQFEPRVVSVVENLEDINFEGQP